jgi:hypothetical protein
MENICIKNEKRKKKEESLKSEKILRSLRLAIQYERMIFS